MQERKYTTQLWNYDAYTFKKTSEFVCEIIQNEVFLNHEFLLFDELIQGIKNINGFSNWNPYILLYFIILH
jgi:hypothetical protein